MLFFSIFVFSIYYTNNNSEIKRSLKFLYRLEIWPCSGEYTIRRIACIIGGLGSRAAAQLEVRKGVKSTAITSDRPIFGKLGNILVHC